MGKDQVNGSPNSKVTVGFTPMKLVTLPQEMQSNSRITATTTIKGAAADEFEELAEKYQLTKSQLLLQMIHHCLNRTDELKEFYKRLAILGK